MTIAELRARATELEANGVSSHNQWMAIHRKFSSPVACLVFGLIGLALGATNRRDGTLGSFVLGVVIVFAYYIPLYLGPALAKGGLIAPWLAVWLPNIVLGGLGFALFAWRDRVADQPFRLSMPAFLQRRTKGTAVSSRPGPRPATATVQPAARARATNMRPIGPAPSTNTRCPARSCTSSMPRTTHASGSVSAASAKEVVGCK